MAEKKYHASTGVDSFYYGILSTDNELEIVEASPEFIDFLQNITVSSNSQLVKAHGNNRVAEMAVSNGDVTVSGNFHKIPMEDQRKLLGYKTLTNGLVGSGSDDNPPYVACVFAKTHEDGSREWVGLPKGKFMRTDVEGNTKADQTQFSTSAISAEFMDREITGSDTPLSRLFAESTASDNEQRDALFQAVFGKPHPDATPEI